MAKPLEALMQKEMTRKEFLATIAFGTATLFGLGGLLKLLGKQNPLSTSSAQPGALGYGMSAYGGSRK